MLQWRYIASSDPIWFVRSHSGYLETKFRIFFQNLFFPQWIVSEVEMFAIVANMCHRLKYENFKSLPHKYTTSVNSKFHLPYASTNQTSDKISNFDCSIMKKNDFSVFTFLVMVDKLERVENNFIFVSHPNDVIIWLLKYDSLTNEIKFIPFPLSGSRTISLVVLFGQWKHANWSRVWDVSKAIRPNVLTPGVKFELPQAKFSILDIFRSPKIWSKAENRKAASIMIRIIVMSRWKNRANCVLVHVECEIHNDHFDHWWIYYQVLILLRIMQNI